MKNQTYVRRAQCAGPPLYSSAGMHKVVFTWLQSHAPQKVHAKLVFEASKGKFEKHIDWQTLMQGCRPQIWPLGPIKKQLLDESSAPSANLANLFLQRSWRLLHLWALKKSRAGCICMRRRSPALISSRILTAQNSLVPRLGSESLAKRIPAV